MVGLLLQNGADVNARNTNFKTPLDKAVKGGHQEVIEMLLKYGAKKDPYLKMLRNTENESTRFVRRFP